ncbi:hypothetical protein AGR8A_Cc40515 [Agrobacterium fabrum str. J-07]|nr:hypothetical protein AGR8A_Cc40515 [Agrobacterium fabrum str. J-07]
MQIASCHSAPKELGDFLFTMQFRFNLNITKFKGDLLLVRLLLGLIKPLWQLGNV